MTDTTVNITVNSGEAAPGVGDFIHVSGATSQPVGTDATPLIFDEGQTTVDHTNVFVTRLDLACVAIF